MSANLILELLNGGAVTPEVIWLAMLTLYLVKESRRRGLRSFDWLKLPPSMNFILAIFIGDAAVTAKSMVDWTTLHFGLSHFVQISLLIGADSVLGIAFLCKIRALTAPDHGNLPWLFVGGLSTVAIIALAFAR